MAISMRDILNSGKATGLRNQKQRRILQNLRWRQKYQNADLYEYTFGDHLMLPLKQISNGELKGLGTGTFVWPAAHVLAKYFERQFGDNNTLKQKRVCELGCGVGLNGIVAALLGAEVVLTDQEVIIPCLQENIQQLRAHLSHNSNCAVLERLDHMEIYTYDWNSEPSFPFTGDNAFDFLIVSDCVLPKLYPIELLIQVTKPCNAYSKIMFCVLL